MLGRWLSRLVLVFMSISSVEAKEPIFCKSSSCQIRLASQFDQRRAYVIVQPGASTVVSFRLPSTSTLKLQILFPLKYTPADLDGVMDDATYTSRLNPYLQTAEFKPTNGSYNLTSASSSASLAADGSFFLSSDDNVHFSVPSGTAETPLLLVVGETATLTALEVVSLPIAMFNAHGEFFTRQGYYWIFIIVGAVISTLYVAFARVRVWQAALVFGMGAFAVVFFEKLYHAILASLLTGTAAEIAYMIVCVVFLAEAIPFVVAAIIMRQAKCRAVPWGIVGLLFAVGFLFLAGSGWFVGVGLLGIASLLRILSRALL